MACDEMMVRSFIVLIVLGHVASKTYLTGNCPRQPKLINGSGRRCLKKCRSDEDCRGKNKRCLCDDVCGMSCVKPSKRCHTLDPIKQGTFEITPFNTFGAKVRYTCNEGHVLSGEAERICQGDGKWSGKPPSCETRGKCHEPPTVPFAKHDGPETQKVFPLGTQLQYKCKVGYQMNGFFRAMCAREGRWVGPRMTCTPRRCGNPGEIAHGRRDGNAFIFPNRIKYTCDEGFELVGTGERVCQASGKWSGVSPWCRPVRCPRLTAPSNGNMYGVDFTYGAVVRFSCYRGFRLLGSQARRCTQDGSWSGQAALCKVIDCGLPGPFYNGYLDGQQTTFSSIIKFRCFSRATFEGPSIQATCQENGDWSFPLPKCWSQCEVPLLANGSAVADPGTMIRHGSNITFHCNLGHQLNTSKIPVCHNGTWTFLPRCDPAPCVVRPDPIRNGYVRFHQMIHGSRAKYKCNTGYYQLGDQYLTCLYGEWIGTKPSCEPAYCNYPGTLEHGQILLVGVIGKYEYRHYVARIGHNEQIEYHCNKGYKIVGPWAATCVNGLWSPPKKPKCKPARHLKMMSHFHGRRIPNYRHWRYVKRR